MKFYIYSVYDPEVGSFDTRLDCSPLGLEQHAEQCRRAFIKMDEKGKAFLLGKSVMFMGMFDDETGKIDMNQPKEIHLFELPKEDKKEEEEKEA